MISLLYIPTSQQTADTLTKAVPRKAFDELNSKLGLLNIYNLAGGEYGSLGFLPWFLGL